MALKITELKYDDVTAMDFVAPATWFIINASGVYVWIHTAQREIAQAWVDDMYGKGKYAVKAAKLQKTRSRQENGGLTCRGTQTRRGQRK